MRATWIWVFVVCVVACASAERGGSLRGALEALQRRQRSRLRGQVPPPDYEALYEFVPPQTYPEPDYGEDVEDMDEEPSPQYIVKLLGNERPSKAYEYQIMKKNSAFNGPIMKQESPFRERSQHSDNDRLRDLFMDRNEGEENSNALDNKQENDAEYALLLSQLWSKYKNNKDRTNADSAPQGVVKLYKEKIVKKRYPNNWGPIAFKRKRSSDSGLDRSILTDTEAIKKPVENMNPIDPNNSYEIPEDDRDEMREEYAIAFQPLDDDSLSDLADEDQYAYESIEKRFPISKRSSGPYNFNSQKKRFVPDQGQHDNSKSFRSSAGTDPKIINDLSKIFGDADSEIIKSPVKRSSEYVEGSHDTKPPTLIMESHNHTQDHNNGTHHNDHSHEEHSHNIHPPVISSKEHEQIHHDHNHDHDHDHDHDHNHDHDHSHDHNNHSDDHKYTQDLTNHDLEHDAESEKPIKIKKKSIDWSDYFGIDKRLQKSVSFVNNLNEDRLKKQYFDTFNKEVIYPLNSFRKHSFVKRNFVQAKSNKESELQANQILSPVIRDEKRSPGSDNESKLDNIDRKLRNMEGLIVDEALHYSNIGEELDSKEEQEMKEKLLSRLAAAYSLEKMRKALKDFKQSLQLQKTSSGLHSSPDHADAKDKRVAVKKEKVILSNEIPTNNHEKNEDFEDEQGAGHYLNGKIEEQLSEGYMGGSGRHRIPVMSTVSSSGACPVLAKIVQRCRGVDLLAGDRGQLFLPLCSLHQICYLCGEAPPTTCDLVFLSEADSTCEGDMSCQRAARSALMALRELHDNLADELDGECEASPCLPATLKLNLGWQRALQRLIMANRTENESDRGLDNHAATEDDGSTVRPALVINIQPQSQEINRAELPVSTTDWQSNTTRGQFIPMHGLDFLIGVSSLQIQQTVELIELTATIESENRYIVKIPQGEALYIASEVSTPAQRCLCGTGRGFVMHLHDNTRQEALVMHRRLAAASCWFPCRLQEMKVITPPGDYIGRIQQQWTWVVPFYLVRDVNDTVVYVLEGPISWKRSLQLSEFKILTGDSLRQVGKICHGWDRELVSFTTNISYPAHAVQPKHKALILAAAFLLEYTYFERAKTSCWRCNCC
ncbi:uncharacterized protein [Maniola hyperantus]|uniref:uncharacterized protein n=1 Tax=Aphantopus hyperantus TaxID=2795564 RepID=UPI003747F474